jgi:membrane protease YdiL (CAAX protease family)
VQEPVAHTGRSVFEVAFTFILIVLAVWTPRPQQDWVVLVAFLWIVLSTVLVRENRRAVELGVSGLRRSLWVIPAALALAALQILLARHEQTLHPPFSTSVMLGRMWGYVIWSFLQQFILQDYFLVRLLRVVRRPWLAIWISATLFALAHIPNPVLTVLTLIWGVAACTLFLHYRDLYTLGFAHAVFGLTIAISIPAGVHHNMRVGLGYLRYHPKPATQRSQIPHKVSTVAWVITEDATRRSARQARP